jgi:class 3 adenylate cyclase
MLYRFDGYTLDTQHYELCRDGTRLDLRGRPFDALVFLIQHRDRTVLQEELFAHLWPNAFRSNASLENCIKKVRRALGDTGDRQGLIQTVRRRGYRFVALVTEGEAVGPDIEAPVSESSAYPAAPYAAQDAGVLPPSPAAERKQATVLVCVLADAAALAARLGPEAMFSLMQEFFALVHQQVRQFAGSITHVRSSGFTALFGAPLAHEDHAQRAVLAAMGLQKRLREYVARPGMLPGEGLHLRMGVHTGLVVVGSLENAVETAYPALGETTHLANHLQQCATPGTILASATTVELLPDGAGVEVWGPVHSPAQPEPLLAYRLLAYQPWFAPWAARQGRALTCFVGRTRELESLHAHLRRVEAGAGQVVGIVGAPGLGKSRLLYEFRQELRQRRVRYLEARCLSYGGAMPYLPLLGLLRCHWGILDTDAVEVAASKVRCGLQQAALLPDLWEPGLLPWLGMQVDPGRWAEQCPAALSTWLSTALCRIILASSRQQPVVLALEDVHWIDPASEACCTALVERLAGVPLLCLCTYRPGYRPPWREQANATQITLPGLTVRHSRQVLQAVWQTAPVPDNVASTLLTSAAGNPFFLEELARAVVGRDTSSQRREVPPTIQAVLAARIDQLSGADKLLLQAAAVMPHEVPLSLLQALVGQPAAVVHGGLQRLQASEFLHELRSTPEPTYAFTHVLLQEVASQALLQRTRQQYQQRLAQVLAAHYPASMLTPSALRAHRTDVGLGAQEAPEAVLADRAL